MLLGGWICQRYQCLWAAVLLVGNVLSLVPGMALVNLARNDKKPPSPADKDIFSAEFGCQKSRLQLGCHLHRMSLTVGWKREITILKSLIEWWLIRAVHHRETNPGVNRCLFCILQPARGKKKSECAQQVIPIWHAGPGNNNQQVPICVQLLKNYHPAWYYPSALGELVLWKELLMADFSIP